MDAKIVALDGSEKGTAALPDDLFAQQVNEHLLWLSVKRYLGNQRQGTAKVKARGEVSGGGRKPWRQKGTGRARAGSNTSRSEERRVGKECRARGWGGGA